MTLRPGAASLWRVRLTEGLARTCFQSAPGVDALPTIGCLVNTFDLIRGFLGPAREAAEDAWPANHKGAGASRKKVIRRPELRCQSGAPPANGRVAGGGGACWGTRSERVYFLVLVSAALNAANLGHRSQSAQKFAVFPVCGPTFEVTGPLRQDGLARLTKMYCVPPTGPSWPAVAVRLTEGLCVH